MEAASLEVRFTRAVAQPHMDFVSADDGLDQLRAARLAVGGHRNDGGNDDAAAMRRAVAVAVVELDAVRGGAAEERGVEQVGAARAAGHRHGAGRARHIGG